MEEKKAGDDFLINLGADRSIKLQREKTLDKVAETFFGMVDSACED